MGGGRGLAAAALVIHHRDNLQSLACPAVRQIPAVSPGPLVELHADFRNVLDRVAAPAAFSGNRLSPFGPQLPQIAFRNAQQLGRLRRTEPAYGLLGFGRKNVTM